MRLPRNSYGGANIPFPNQNHSSHGVLTPCSSAPPGCHVGSCQHPASSLCAQFPPTHIQFPQTETKCSIFCSQAGGIAPRAAQPRPIPPAPLSFEASLE